MPFAEVDAVSDLRLQSEAESLSIFVPEDAPLEQRDSDPPCAQAQPTRGDFVHPDTYMIWPVDDDDRSWWSCLRSLTASWGTKYLRRRAHDEPVATEANMPGPAARTGEVTMEAIRNLDKHLASLAALRDACESIDRRLARVEEVSRQRDHATVDGGLHDVCWQMSDRLVRIESVIQHTEDALHRRDSIVTEWLKELSADMTARFAEAEEAIQRIEQIVSSRTVEQTAFQQPSVRTHYLPVQAKETAHTTPLFLSRFLNIERMNRPLRQPWMARLAIPVLALVAVLAIGALMTTSRVAPDKVVPLTTGDQVVTPVEQAPNQGIRDASTTTLVADPRSTGESRVSAPEQRSPARRSAGPPSRSPRFVGTLSITSVPSGASVSINGKPAGVTPLRLARQRAGSLAVQVAHDGFERWSAAVVVPADRLTQVTAKLRAAR
jgi:hypothetical protein